MRARHREMERLRRERILQAWEAANFQGLKPSQLQALLDRRPIDGADQDQTDEEIFAVMSQWRAAAGAAHPRTA